MASKKSATPAKKRRNPALPRVPLTIDDQEYILEYDFNAIALAEQLTGLNLFSSFDFSNLSATRLRAMLYSSLIKNHPDITVEDAGDLITAKTLADITVKMVEAWHGSRPEVVAESKPGVPGGNVEAEVEVSE